MKKKNIPTAKFKWFINFKAAKDFKKMGSYYKYLSFDVLISFICIINLSGLPLTFGFFNLGFIVNM